MTHEIHSAVAGRNAAVSRVRRATGVAVVVGAAMTAALTAVAGSSTHLRRSTVKRLAAPRARRASPVVAPRPPLVAAHTQPVAPPPAAPAPTPIAPVVVSGGS